MRVWPYFLKSDGVSMRLTWVSAMSPVYPKSGAVLLHTVGKDHTFFLAFFCGNRQELRSKLYLFVISTLSHKKYQAPGIYSLLFQNSPIILYFLIIVVWMNGRIVCQSSDFKCLVEIAGLTQAIPQGQSSMAGSPALLLLVKWWGVKALTVLGWQVTVVVTILQRHL